MKAETALIVADTDVIDDGTSGLVKIAADVAAVLVDTGTTLDAAIAVIDTNVDQIETAVITNAAGVDISADILVIDNFVDGIETAVITNAAGTDIAADIIAIKAETALIVTDTGTTLDTKLNNLDLGIIYGVAETGTLSTTVATTDLTGFVDDELIGRAIIFTGGTADGQASDITDYASASGTVTYTAIPTAPANADTFKIV